jgi:hypothetical protein
LSTWQVRGRGETLVPPQLRVPVAGIGARLGAWAIDLVLFGLLGLIPLALASFTGAIGLNAEWVRETGADPYLQATVPMLVVDVGPLAAWAGLWVILAIVYSAACWAGFGGLPGQRAISLKVVDASTGRNLSPLRASLRAVLLTGIPAAATAVLVVATCQMLTQIAPANLNATNEANYIGATYNNAVGDLITGCDFAVVLWPLILLVSTATSRDRRGLHDRLSGSVVLGRNVAFGAWGYAGSAGIGPGGIQFGPEPGYWPAPPGVPGRPPIPLGYPMPQPPPPGPAEGPAPQQAEMPPKNPAAEANASRDGEPAQRSPASENPQVFGALLPEGLRVAGINRRMAAYLIDTAVVLALLAVAATVVFGDTDPNAGRPAERLVMLSGLIGGLAQAVYFVAAWSIWRGSLGQKALGLQVGEESTGRRLGFADALVRWALLQGPLALVFSVPGLLQPSIGALAIGWMWLLMFSARRDPDHRGYHDRIAHSLVAEQV